MTRGVGGVWFLAGLLLGHLRGRWGVAGVSGQGQDSEEAAGGCRVCSGPYRGFGQRLPWAAGDWTGSPTGTQWAIARKTVRPCLNCEVEMQAQGDSRVSREGREGPGSHGSSLL